MDGVAEEARWGVGDERSALKEQALKKVAAHLPLRDLSQTHDQSSRMKKCICGAEGYCCLWSCSV